MNKTLVVIFTLAFSWFMNAAAFAHYHQEHMQKLVKELNLTADQQAKLKAIKQEEYNSLKGLKEQMHALHPQMHNVVRSNPMDEGKMNDLINQKKELIGSMMKVKLMAKNKIYNMLNDQQKVKFQAMMQRWEEKKMHMYNKMDKKMDKNAMN